MPDLARRFIALVSRLAPGWARREFRAEWEAEIETAWRDRPRRSWRDSARVIRRAAGAVPAAWFLFRQQWSTDMLLHDVRYALRLMAQRPGFTAVVVMTLALGIGANTAVFSVINAVLLRPLPFGEPERAMAVWENDRVNGKPRSNVAPPISRTGSRRRPSSTSRRSPRAPPTSPPMATPCACRARS